MYKELKKQIIIWLFEHQHTYQRIISCIEEFRPYIYNKDGDYLIGGKDTIDFIKKADELIHSEEYL